MGVWVCGCVQSRAGGAAAAHVMRMQIQATDVPKFHVNQYLHLSRIDSGIDSLKAKTRTGKEEEVESEEEEKEEEEDDGEDVEGEVAQHRNLVIGMWAVFAFLCGDVGRVEASRWR